MLVDTIKDQNNEATFSILKKNFLIIITLRLMIEKYTPKLLGENLNYLSLSLKVINFVVGVAGTPDFCAIGGKPRALLATA